MLTTSTHMYSNFCSAKHALPLPHHPSMGSHLHITAHHCINVCAILDVHCPDKPICTQVQGVHTFQLYTHLSRIPDVHTSHRSTQFSCTHLTAVHANHSSTWQSRQKRRTMSSAQCPHLSLSHTSSCFLRPSFPCLKAYKKLWLGLNKKF